MDVSNVSELTPIMNTTLISSSNGKTVISHTIDYNETTKKAISTILFSDGTTDVKDLDMSQYLQKEYTNGQNSVDFDATNYDVESNAIKITNILTNGKSQEYTVILDEQTIVNLYNEIMAGKYSYFWIKQGDTEYSFLVENREYQPQPNIALQNAINGTPEYEILGVEQKQWDFTIYVDSIPKMQFLQQLATNPLCEVYFDEISGYKQCLIKSIQISRITSGYYNADIEIVIL